MGSAEPDAQRTALALLKLQDYEAWSAAHLQGACSGDIGPYGLRALLERGYDLRFSDAPQRRPWSSPLLKRPFRKLAHLRPELEGALGGLLSLRAIAGSQLMLGIFEEQGMFAATAKARGLAPFANRPLCVIACWLAEDCRHFDARTLAAVRRSLQAVDRLLYFSSNQAATFTEELGVEPARLGCVPFGVDDRFFSPAGVADEGYVLAVGRDRSRDHALLVNAVRDSGLDVRLAGPTAAELPALPSEVRLLGAVDHRSYRDLLARAAVVVVPTHAPRYPGGQTVVLEAMAMGKPVLTTDSAAMRDYVTPGLDGELVAQGDGRALLEGLRALLADDVRRRALGERARETVEQRFNHRAMWNAVADQLDPLARAPARRRSSRMSSAPNASSRIG
jgi:glycosyltransferase involved in cell wall biosynthesis